MGPGVSGVPQIEVWNKKVHIYIGLFLLWFIWLFGLSGLLLNHSRWLQRGAWQGRTESEFTHSVQPSTGGDDLETARALMEQVSVRGEIERITSDPQGRFEFRVVRPGVFSDLSVNWNTLTAEVKTTRAGNWMVFHNLHSFNGTHRGRESRDWMPTHLWVISMDGVCVGLVLLVFSSLYMWIQVERMRLVGLAALGAGVLSCGFFVFGLG